MLIFLCFGLIVCFFVIERIACVKNKNKFDEIIEKTEKAQDYIRLYKEYQYAMSYKELDADYVLPIDVEIFLKLQNELNIYSVEDAKQLIKFNTHT